MSYKFRVPSGGTVSKVFVGEASIKAPHGNFKGKVYLSLNYYGKAMWWCGGRSGMIAQFEIDGRFVDATINENEGVSKSHWGFEGKWYVGVPVAAYNSCGDYDGTISYCSPLILDADGDRVIAAANEKLNASAGNIKNI